MAKHYDVNRHPKPPAFRMDQPDGRLAGRGMDVALRCGRAQCFDPRARVVVSGQRLGRRMGASLAGAAGNDAGAVAPALRRSCSADRAAASTSAVRASAVVPAGSSTTGMGAARWLSDCILFPADCNNLQRRCSRPLLTVWQSQRDVSSFMPLDRYKGRASALERPRTLRAGMASGFDR